MITTSRPTRSPTYLAWQRRGPCALATPAVCAGAVEPHHADPDDDMATCGLCELHGREARLKRGEYFANALGGQMFTLSVGTLRFEALRAWMRFTKTAAPEERRQVWAEIEECLA